MLGWPSLCSGRVAFGSARFRTLRVRNFQKRRNPLRAALGDVIHQIFGAPKAGAPRILYPACMRAGLSLRSNLITALCAYAATAALAWRYEGLLLRPADGLHAQAAAQEEAATEARATQRLRQTPDAYIAEYSFENFNRDLIEVRYQTPRSAYASYCGGFWYSKVELDAIETWHNQARQGAYQLAADARKTQAQLDAALSRLKAERDKRMRDYLASRGFRLLSGDLIEADVPQIVRRSRAPLEPLALAFERIAAAKSYDSESLVGSVLAMVQTALHYQIPPNLEKGRHTGGILPPLMALMRGWGDCDSKTGLLASVLANWPQLRMVGIAVPDHYLMAILRIPGKGDAFVEYQGLQYVLVEPAGPAWLPPGTVGADTLPMLQASDGFRVEPFFGPDRARGGAFPG